MKKIITAIAVLLNVTAVMSQSELDIPKYLHSDILGTARYMSMAGAFGALGGDASAIKDNPAALGVYRTSELVGTANFSIQNGNSTWGTKNSQFSDPFRVGFNNFGFVIASKTWRLENDTKGLLYSNWSFGYNRLKNFSRNLNINGSASESSLTDFMAAFTNNRKYVLTANDLSIQNGSFNDISIPWLSILAKDGFLIDTIPASGGQWGSILHPGQKVSPAFLLTELGHIDQFNLAWGGNVNHILYLGASANLQTLNYSATSTYSETFINGNNENLKLRNEITSTGTGFNLNLGAIVRPTDFLRLGLSFRTPTFYTITDKYFSSLETTVVLGGKPSTGTTDTPDDAFNYFKIQGPIQLNGSVAVVLGKKGLLSGEYNYSNFTGTRLMTKGGSMNEYQAENDGMSQMLKDLHTFKVGGEFKVTDNFALRAGYALLTPSTTPSAQKIMINNSVRSDTESFLYNGTSYITGGFGYREASWFLDLAYMYKVVDQTYVPYNINSLNPNFTNPSASLLTTNHNIAVTLGLKF